jgi:anti-sigma regulatory factor (Ser/Thr protein kinase)
VRELALHLLDIAENSIAAGARNIQIVTEEDKQKDRLRMAVIDDGNGMDAQMAAQVIDPFVTSRSTRKVGLGIPLLKEAAEACEGWLTIQSTPGKGTCLEVEFQDSHIDRMPLGDLPATWLSLLVTSPQVHWIFRYSVDGYTFEFDDEELKKELGDIPMSDPAVLAFLRKSLEEGFQALQIK